MKTNLRFLCLCALLAASPASADIHYVDAASTNPVSPYTDPGTPARVIQDAVDASVAGDEIEVADGVYSTGGRAVGTSLLVNRVAVDRAVTVRSKNGPEVTVIQGYQVPETINGVEAIRCVYLTNGAVLSGFTLSNGATRASGDYCQKTGGGVWCVSTDALVSNCMFTSNSAVEAGGAAFSGTLNNCTLTGSSVAGGDNPRGGGAYGSILNSCAITGNSVAGGWGFGGGVSYGTLNNCTLTNNSAAYGGGSHGGVLNNCTLRSNSTWYFGGGANGGTLNNCTLTGNTSPWHGGGASSGTLNNCTLTGNFGQYGGGVSSCTLNNCTLTGNSASAGGGTFGSNLNSSILYYNTATSGPNCDTYSILNYCCTTPAPASGIGNITAEPLFVDRLNGDLRLQANSPCIDWGYNAYAIGSTDLAGNPRTARLRVDIGAYEYQGAGLSEFVAWLQNFGLATDGTADFTDPDGDGHDNHFEFTAGLVPTDPQSRFALHIASVLGQPAQKKIVFAPIIVGRSYSVEYRDSLATPPWTPLTGTTQVDSGSERTVTDTGATGPRKFYHVKVEKP
ncbi:MAG: right-handed parallel beta-helix repeat-containing protein [Verrucomicrobia bacterium]|nr:right-handed parallel beta-helix repeat-containing protein [Verrucomicrobiota bacterium]